MIEIESNHCLKKKQKLIEIESLFEPYSLKKRKKEEFFNSILTSNICRG